MASVFVFGFHWRISPVFVKKDVARGIDRRAFGEGSGGGNCCLDAHLAEVLRAVEACITIRIGGGDQGSEQG